MVVYEEWIKEKLYPDDVPDFRGNPEMSPQQWVDSHCIWAATPQGHTVWWKLEVEWWQICARHEVRFKHTKEVLW